MARDGVMHLHGRNYKTVALRVQEFREKHPISDGWAIVSTLVHCDSESVLIRSSIKNPEGIEVAVGFAEEKRSARGVNSTSALENCETSAIGRALAAAGYAGTEYASADELDKAAQVARERAAPPQRAAAARSAAEAREELLRFADELGVCESDLAAYLAAKGRPALADLSVDQIDRLGGWLAASGGDLVAAWVKEGGLF